LRKLIYLLLLIFLSSNVLAKDNSKEVALFKATMFASQLSQAATLENMSTNLFLTDADRKLFLEDLKKNKQLKSPMPKFSYNGTVVVIGEGSAQLKVEFKDISNKVIYLNNKKVEIKEYKPYVNSLVLIRDVFKKSSINTFLNLFINEAYADTSTRSPWSFDFIYAALISSQSKLENLTPPNAALAETILQTYEKLMDNGQYKYLKHQRRFILLPRFTCKDGRLDEIREWYNSLDKSSAFQANFELYLKYDPQDNSFNVKEMFMSNHIMQKNKETETGSKLITMTCDIRSKYDGTITESTVVRATQEEVNFKSEFGKATCPEIGSSLFDISSKAMNVDEKGNIIQNDLVTRGVGKLIDFQYTKDAMLMPKLGQFPIVADACCKETGCAEQVNAGIDKKIQSYRARFQKESKAAEGTR